MNEWHNAKAELEEKLPRYRELESELIMENYNLKKT